MGRKRSIWRQPSLAMSKKECLSTNGEAEDQSSEDNDGEPRRLPAEDITDPVQDVSNQVIWNVEKDSRNHPSLKRVLSSLSQPAQSLLLLMSVCKGPSVPEEVLQVMYGSRKFQWGKASFSEVQKELEQSKLVVVNSAPCEWNDRDSKMTRGFWSLNDEHGNSLREEMKEKIESLMHVLFGTDFDIHAQPTMEEINNEEVFIKILYGLYFNERRSEKTSDQRLDAVGRGVAVEPLIWLIPQSERNQSPDFTARKVIIGFICEGSIEDSHLRHLLIMEFSRRAMCWALGLMFAESHDQRHIHNERPCDMIKTVVGFLARFRYLHLTDNLALVLCRLEQLGSDPQIKTCVVMDNFKLFLTNLRNILEESRSSLGNELIAASITATMVLQWLLSRHEYGGQASTVLEALDVLLESSNHKEDLVAAAGELMNTSLKKQTQISEAAASLLELLHMLSNGRPSHQLKGEVLRALSSLPSDRLMQIPFLDHREALNELVRLFVEDDEAEVRKQSAQILWSFAANGLRESSRSLDLQDMMGIGGSEVEHAVAIALLVLSHTHSAPDPYIEVLHQRHPSVLDQLNFVLCMGRKKINISPSICSDATAQAECVLLCLSEENPQPLWKGDTLIYFLIALVRLMDTEASKNLQQLAAKTLANLADNGTIQLKVAKWRGFADSELLWVYTSLIGISIHDQQQHSPLQGQTARTIANLCETGSLAVTFECYPGACGTSYNLHKWKQSEFVLGRHAARALSGIYRRRGCPEGKHLQPTSSTDEIEHLLKQDFEINRRNSGIQNESEHLVDEAAINHKPFGSSSLSK